MNFKKILCLSQCLLLIIFCLSFIKLSVKAASAKGLGDIYFQEKRNIYDNVSLEYSIGFNNNEDQKAYTLEMSKNSLIPRATYGTYVYGGEKLTSMIEQIEKETNKKVVCALNGGYYDTSNGIPQGAMIVDGKVVTFGTSAGGEAMVGFKEDGSFVMGNLNASLSFNNGETDINIKHYNNDRKINTTDLFLYTTDYNTSTKSNIPGLEIVLEVGNVSLFEFNKEVKAKVVKVGSIDTKIEKNQIVIASGNVDDQRLTGLAVGKEITVTLKENNSKFKDVVNAFGYGNLLAENGVVNQGAISDAAVHPRSAIGVKEDGTVVLFQVDGRQPGWSNGVTFKQMIEWLMDVKGCVTVLNLDGGGSSTLVARLPGDENGSILNSPSDGFERNNSNAILFFAPDDKAEDSKLEYIHSYPKNLVILENGKIDLEIKGTDRFYYPVAIDNSKNVYNVDSEVGLMNGNVFIAGKGPKKAKITATYEGVSTEIDVTIVDQVSKITADKTIISISPEESIEIKLNVYSNGIPVICSNQSFQWRLSSSTIGTIDNGVFTGSSEGGTGSITIQYKNYEISIPVEVGKQPVILSTFENAVIGSNWNSIIETPGNGGKGNVSLNTDERYVKFGKKSLRMDYDFRDAIGTTSVTAYTPSYIKLEGYPSHIGIWVYGDGNNANLRIQLRDGKNAVQYLSFTPEFVSWTGWKYVEAEIPSGLPTPIQIQYAVRVMSVSGKIKSNGTLYFDNLRAVYGFRNDDTMEPVCTDLTPAENSIVDSLQPQISMIVKDGGTNTDIVTGINKNSVEFYLNDKKMDNVVIQDLEDSAYKINYTPSALSLLRSGPQIVKIRVEDNYGNITIKQWQFYVAGSYIGVSGVLPSENLIFAGDKFVYDITCNSYQGFTKFSGILNFNYKTVALDKVEVLDKNLKLSADTIDNANKNGIMNFTIEDMNKSTIRDDKVLLRLVFKTVEGFVGGSNASITFKDCLVKTEEYSSATSFLLPSYEGVIDYRYRISYLTSTKGSPITFKVTDEALNPISDVSFSLTGTNIRITGTTGDDGYATFNEFATLSAGSVFTIQAIKGSNYSEKISITIMASLKDSSPTNIFVSPGNYTSNSVIITWQTDIDTKGTVVEYRKTNTSTWINNTVASYTKQVYVKNNNVAQEYLNHIVEINNLEANCEYEYRVGDGNVTSSINIFKTTNDSDIDMLFLGDPQNTSDAGYNVTKGVVSKALELNPSTQLIMYAGDIVDDVQIYSQWESFHKVLGSYNSSLITACATGNHDVITGYADPFKYSLAPLQNGVDTIGVNYSFVAGSSLIFVIDTETPAKFNEQAAWMKSVSYNTDAKFRIVLLHRGPYAANYNEPHIRDFWPTQFEDAKIDVVLSGHDHVYSSTKMLNNKKNDDGILYVVGGTTGQKYYSASNLESRYWLDFLFDDDMTVYSTISIKGDELSFKAFSFRNGVTTLLEERKLTKKVHNLNAVVTINPVDKIFTSLNKLKLTGNVKDENGEIVSNGLSWSLKEEVKGVSILQDGTIVVTKELVGLKEITVTGKYFDNEKDIKVKVTYISADDYFSIEYQKYLEMLSKVLK